MSENNAAVKTPLTKEQKIANIEKQIANLTQRLDDVRNDRVTVRTKKEVFVPTVGANVLATVGRNSATTQAKIVPGVVTAVKYPEVVDGKTVGGVQVRVRIYEGTFDEQLVTLYPSQLTVPASSNEDAPAAE